MRWIALLSALFLGACEHHQSSACVGAEKLAHAVVKIEGTGVIPTTWRQGSGWFLRETEIVTVDHVAEQLGLTRDTWKNILISQRTGPSNAWQGNNVRVRIKEKFDDSLPEPLHVIELQERLTWQIEVVTIRHTPLRRFEPVAIIGYSAGELLLARGYFVGAQGLQPTSVSGYLHFNFTLGENKHPTRGGSSGGGVFDCEGRVSASHSRATSEYFAEGGTNAFGVAVYPAAKSLIQDR